MNKENFSLGDMNTLNGDKIVKTGGGQLLFAGDEIGGYKVIKQLGAGGMGQVYLVENIQMHKQYALKVLPPHLSQNKNFIDRFRVEARVMADLDHPNIVGVMNIGHDTERSLYYLVMQYVSSVNRVKLSVNGNQLSDENIPEGDAPAELCSAADFEELLKDKKKLSEDYVLKITRQLCSALNYAHNFRGKGIVHRDLKPSNILLDGDGNAHIADFGLAKVLGTDYLKSMIDRSMRLTMGGATTSGKNANMSLGDMNTMIEGEGSSQTTDHGSPISGSGGTTGSAGSLIGTYEYMAPEQQDGQEATVQSDIYSLGLIIYRMLTGKKAKGRFKLPSELGYSGSWDKIIHKCLEIEAEDRFVSVKEIVSLLTFSVGEDGQSRLQGRQKKQKAAKSSSNRSKIIIGLFAVVFIIFLFMSFGGWFGYRAYDKNQTEKANVARLAQMKQEKQERISKLTVEMNDAFASDKYPEASKYANQVLTIDPNNGTAKKLIQKIINNANYKETAPVKVQCEYAVKKVSKLTFVDGKSKEQEELQNSLNQNLDIGTQFFNDKEYRSAMEYFQKILSAAGKIKEIESNYVTFLNAGKRELSAKKANVAVVSFNEALKYKKSYNVQKLISDAQYMIKYLNHIRTGTKQFQSKNWKKAENSFELALSVPGYTNDKDAISGKQKTIDSVNKEKYENLIALGNKHSNGRNWKEAKIAFSNALKVSGYSSSFEAESGFKSANKSVEFVKKKATALASFNSIIKDTKQLLLKDGNYDKYSIEAYTCYDKATKIIKKFTASNDYSYLNEKEKLELTEQKDMINKKMKLFPPFLLGNKFYKKEDYQNAILLLRKAAGKGNSEAMFLIGSMYNKGQGIAQSFYEAANWFDKAADLGNNSAIYNLGLLYRDGNGVTKDSSKAMELFKKAADKGDSDAMNQLGYLYGGGHKDPQKAFIWFQKAADKGNIDAMKNVGIGYQMGWGVTKNSSEADRWFIKYAELLKKDAYKGNTESMTQLADNYRFGTYSFSKDSGKYVQWYKKAAEKGNPNAMYNLGFLYQYGLGVTQNYSKAMEWYKKAAKLGNATAQKKLKELEKSTDSDIGIYSPKNSITEKNELTASELYEKGKKCYDEKKSKEAMKWYIKAAEKGDASAMTNIGNMYFSGDGVIQDYSEAMEWFKKAIAKDEPSAMVMLATMYSAGIGVKKNIEGARKLYRKAAKSGNESAKKSLEIFEKYY